MVLFRSWFSDVKAGEMVKFPKANVYGMAELRKNNCGIVVFGNDFDIKAGDNSENS